LFFAAVGVVNIQTNAIQIAPVGVFSPTGEALSSIALCVYIIQWSRMG
jgi:hypothetical protein